MPDEGVPSTPTGDPFASLAPEIVLFNPFLPEVRANPYPLYHRLRGESPVYRAGFGFWLLTRHADGEAVLRDRRFVTLDPRDREEFLGPLVDRQTLGELDSALLATMLFKNPPDHTRIRGLVSKAFTPRVVEGMRSRIQAIVDGLLDAALERGSMEVIADLAHPLPVTVIAEMMGVPAADAGRFRRWVADIAPTIDPILLADALARARMAMEEFGEYFRALVDGRRGDPGDDLLSALVAAEEKGDRLSEEELFANAILLLSAGHETTTNLIGNGLLALLRNPGELAKLRADPSLVESAIEELLRYDSPVQMTGRKATQDVEIGGETVRAGERVLVMIGAANRDPGRFSEPDRLDIARNEGEHLSFGGGPHYCLGAFLARIEGRIAIATLVRRFPGLRLVSHEPEWRETVTLRGLRAVHIAFA